MKNWLATGDVRAFDFDAQPTATRSITPRHTPQTDFTYLILAIIAIVVLGSAGAAFNRRES